MVLRSGANSRSSNKRDREKERGDERGGDRKSKPSAGHPAPNWCDYRSHSVPNPRLQGRVKLRGEIKCRPLRASFYTRALRFCVGRSRRQPAVVVLDHLVITVGRFGVTQRAGRASTKDRKSTRLNSSHVSISYAV